MSVENQEATKGYESKMVQAAKVKDPRWLRIDICRDFAAGKCKRKETECRFAHPDTNCVIENRKLTVCYDSMKGKCTREPCKFYHPPFHIKEYLLAFGKALEQQRIEQAKKDNFEGTALLNRQRWRRPSRPRSLDNAIFHEYFQQEKAQRDSTSQFEQGSTPFFSPNSLDNINSGERFKTLSHNQIAQNGYICQLPVCTAGFQFQASALTLSPVQASDMQTQMNLQHLNFSGPCITPVSQFYHGTYPEYQFTPNPVFMMPLLQPPIYDINGVPMYPLQHHLSLPVYREAFRPRSI